MGTTPDLGIPYIENQQAQPEVTHNDALNMLCALLKGAKSLGDNAPPPTPDDGDLYVLGAAPTGLWAGQAHKLAIYMGTAWAFVPGVDSDGTSIAMGARLAGLTVYVQDETKTYQWSGSAWAALAVDPANIAYAAPSPGTATNVKDALDELYGLV